ncbi:MAG TPA: hypothetical protein VMZ91_04655, partial [Candidatus Paceibacterota bacterium]|nr:hypothetical protein [Candidatus Paceibacterota bacterium]
LCLQSPDHISFEVDLVTFREKGQQTKYLSLSFVDENHNPSQVFTKSLDQESFNMLKKFFSQLDWNS